LIVLIFNKGMFPITGGFNARPVDQSILQI
jgi:hypothetical protein